MALQGGQKQTADWFYVPRSPLDTLGLPPI